MPHQVLSLWIRRQPIKIKLVLIILLTCIVALLLEGVAFTVYERIRVKEDMARDLDSLARIIADRNTAALSFNDDRVARETLAALKVKPVVVAACIYDADGKVFARYDSGAEPSFAFPASLKADRQTLIEDGHLHLLEPVVMDGQVLGKVFIRASLKELDQFWLNFLLFAWLIIFLTALVSVWLAARVQRIVSLPLEQLTHTAQAITEQKDYGLRATHSSDDEVGTLVHAFNDMLETIESRNRELLAANGLLAHSQEALRATNESLEQRVAERTAELQALFDSAGVGIMLMKDRRIERCNRRMDEMFGYACGEQIGLSTRIWYLDDGAWQEAGAALSRRIWLGETHVREQAVQHRDGSPFWVRMSARAIDATDPAKGVVGVIEDITAERKAMAEMHEARLLAEDATRMKSEFLANMSHEIRTPMNAVLGMLFLALKNDLPAALRNQLVKAQAAAHSLLGVINDILDFSKIEAGRLELESVEFGLDSVLEQLMTAIGNQAEEKGIEFLIRYDVAMPPLLVGDPLRLAQVFINLCGNAVKFTETGEVELAFRCLHATDDELSIQVSVRDTGIGMSPEVQSRLFEKFTQADQSTTRRFGGTGLGLALSQRLIAMMDGLITVESEKGHGSTFTVEMPLLEERP